MQNDMLRAILARRTVHSYLPEKLSAQIIKNAILAAIHAPNHRMTWPWRFYWLGTAIREKLAEQNPKFSAPGEIIILCIKKSDDETQFREDYASLACAVQNMSLYLASLGYGSKWSTGKLMRTSGLADMIRQDQNAEENPIEICGVFWVGRADENALNSKKIIRPEVSQFLTRIN